MAKPKNLLFAFALRMLVILLANGIVWTVAVQYYYQHKTSRLTLGLVQEELSVLEPRLREVVSHEREKLPTFLAETMLEYKIPFLQLYREGEGLLFNQGSSVLPGRLRHFPNTLPVDSIPEHRLLDIGNEHYLYLFTSVFEPGWYMRAVIPVNSEFIEQTEETTKSAMVVVIITLLQVTLILYPLVLTAYNRSLEDRADLLMSQLWTVLALGNAIAKRDSGTDTHNYRVSYYSLRLAEAMNLAPDRIPGLVKGAFLHDVGKIGVPDSVLLKPGKLNEEEFDIIKRHVSDGVGIIEGVPWLRDAAPVIKGHHERYDGSGYPEGLSGESIPLEARIFSVVDVFDALTSKRSYKEPISAEEALKIMDTSSAEHFDPEIYQSFKKLIPSLFSRISGCSRIELRKLLSHAIIPYFPYLRNRSRKSIYQRWK